MRQSSDCIDQNDLQCWARNRLMTFCSKCVLLKTSSVLMVIAIAVGVLLSLASRGQWRHIVGIGCCFLGNLVYSFYFVFLWLHGKLVCTYVRTAAVICPSHVCTENSLITLLQSWRGFVDLSFSAFLPWMETQTSGAPGLTPEAATPPSILS